MQDESLKPKTPIVLSTDADSNQRRRAIMQLIRLLPDSFQAEPSRLFRESESDPNAEGALLEELRRTLNLCTTQGLLGRRAFIQIAGIITTSGLAALIFPRSARANPMIPFAFLRNSSLGTSSSGYPANSGSDPYWDYVVLLMNMDTYSGGPTTLLADDSNVGRSPTINGTPYVDYTASTSSPYSGRAGCAKFGGSSDYVSFANSSDFNLGSNDFTIELWVNLAALPSTGVYWPFVSQRASNQYAFDVGIYNSSGTYYITAELSTSGTAITNSNNPSASISTGTWYHIAFVRQGSTLRTFINGTQQASASFSGTVFSSSAALTVGYESAANTYLNGSIADLRIYNGAAKYTANFTPPSSPIGLGTPNDKYWGYCVLACPFENTLKDMSGKRVTSYSSASLTAAQKKYGTSSASFDGSSNYLSLSDSSDFDFGSGDFTIEFWAKTSTSLAAHANCVITQSSGGASSDSSFYLGVGTAFGVWLSDGTDWDYSVSTTGVTPNDGSWHHFAAVRNGMQLKLFVDGSSCATLNLPTGTWTIGNSSRPVTIGVQNAASPGAYFSGYIDSLRVTKGYARYTSDFTPPTASFPVGKDESIDPFWTQTVLAMHMDDLTDATGRHSITNNASVSNNTSTYRFGTASASFNGTSNYLTTPSSSDFDFGTGDFTVEAWIYLNNTNWGGIVSRDTSGSGTGGYYFEIGGPSGKLTFYAGGSIYLNQVAAGLLTSKWHHIAYVRQNGTLTGFLNGVAIGSGVSVTNSLTSTLSLGIGAITNAAGGFFPGLIDDLRITKGVARYVQSFTPPTRAFATTSSSSYSDYDPFFSQVALLLGMNGANNSTTFSDASATTKTVTALGNAKISTSIIKFGSGSASFDGTSSTCLSVADHTDFSLGSSDFTLELFLYANSTSGGSCIIGKRPSSGGVGTFLIWLSSGSAYFYLSSNGSSWDLVSALSFGSISTGTWIHLAAVRNGTSILLFKDGSQVNSATTSGTLITNTDPIRIGAESNSAYFNGYVDDLRITKGVARYTTAFAPPHNALPASAGFVTSGLVCLLDAGDCLSTSSPNTTNLLIYSEQLDNAAWTKERASISANSAIGPSGSSTADKLLEDSSSGTHRIIFGSITTSATCYTASIHAKAGGRTQIWLRLYDGTDEFGAVFNLSTGAVTSTDSAAVTAAIVSAGQGYYRCSVSRALRASSSSAFVLYLFDASSSPTYTGDGSSGVYLWGAQLEASPSSGPYIVTTSASASRTISNSWNNLLQSSADGSSPADYDFKLGDGSTSSTYPTFAGVSGGHSANDYFSFDGGDYLTLAGSNTTFLDSLHKAGANFTIVVVFYKVAVTDWDFLIGTAYHTSDTGIGIAHNNASQTGNQETLDIFKSVSGQKAYSCAVDSGLSTNAWHYHAWSVQEGAGAVSFAYGDGNYMPVGSSNLWSVSYSSPSSSAATNALRIGSRPGGTPSYYTSSGTRIAMVKIYNRALSKAELDQNFAVIRYRFGI